MAKKVALSVLAILIFTAAIGDMFNRYSVKAAQPRSIIMAYARENLTVYCEEPNGNEIYVVTPSNGAAAYVVPGGCR